MKTSLTEPEIAYFYNLLFDFEHVKPIGYTDCKVEKEIGEKIILDNEHDKDENITNPILNRIQFAPYYWNKCSGILGHLRNAFAHGNITSVDNDKNYLIKDFSDKSKRHKCNMLAYVDKNRFHNLINVMLKTRDIDKAKKKAKARKSQKRKQRIKK